ncbi:AAA family ATPase [Mucilaginibacter polytrichastri]|uniref:AAA+ ATPase domain-containing protein n=1 Tax=Mucilaginibacter polytrichastri TaxID=1302689 RepID=A0A1Q5ZY76_9SPHI|nr:AAA family ATPase [Mucilaginibacter polytrichastri]OKS86725.1 hypothetical protein RG47T_2182 [Mucilaginibacter polytrichastri]SFS82755.1 TIGR02646 family protein [Mucilaginibacter polytrichastri]
MLRVNRPERPPFYNSSSYILAKEQLESDALSNSQQRLHFNYDILSSLAGDLLPVFHFKCAYCESPVPGPSDFQIDSFRPKGGAVGLSNEFSLLHYYWLAYEWENLLPCCNDCNKHKGNSFPIEPNTERARIGAVGEELYLEMSLLVDPCRDDPREHMMFHEDGTVSAITGKGDCTIEILGLNRGNLVRERQREAQQLSTEIETMLMDDRTEAAQFLEAFTSRWPERPHLGAMIDIALRRIEAERQKKSSPFQSIHVTSAANIVLQSHPVSIQFTEQLEALKRFTIRKIEIKNFKTVETLTLDIPAGQNTDTEAWLLILGDNGIGKSSILQAIALALSSRELINKFKIKPVEVLRHGASEGFVRIHSYEQDELIELRFNKRRFTRYCSKPTVFLLGYGSTRLLPKGYLRSDRYRQPYSNIGNLFDYTAALTDVNKWLSSLPAEEFEQRVAPVLIDLLDMSGKDRVAMENGRLILYHHGDNSDLSVSSDGYKTIIGLACDMMRTLSREKANYHTMQGIVLIDELGNHLHPRWRMKIVPALRRAFPRLQFIVSTHEPLCLRGLLHGEVVVLLRDEKNHVCALDKTLLPDHNKLRVDQLLTSDLFGLLNTLEPSLERKYEDYYLLLSKPPENRNLEEQEKINVLGKELAGEELIGSTPQLQALYGVINETFAKKMREDGFKTKAQVKASTIAEVKNLLDKPEFDWL